MRAAPDLLTVTDTDTVRPGTEPVNSGTEANGAADEAPDRPDGISEETLRQRLARQERVHAKQLEEAKRQAVSEFREKSGITDSLLEKVKGSELGELYGSLAKAQERVRELEGREAARLEADRQAKLGAALFAKFDVFDASRDHVLADLGAKIALDAEGQLCNRDDPDESVSKLLHDYFKDRGYLLRASPSGGSGSRVQRPLMESTQGGPPRGALGETPGPVDEAAKLAAWQKYRRR